MDLTTKANEALKEAGFNSRIVGYSDLGAFYTYQGGEDEETVQKIVQDVVYAKQAYSVNVVVNYQGFVEALDDKEAAKLAIEAALTGRDTKVEVEKV